jgi:starch synthase
MPPEPQNSDRPIRALFVTSELYPYTKTGGLADVSAALPAALNRIGADCRLLLPGYQGVLHALKDHRVVADFATLDLAVKARLLQANTPEGTVLYVIDCPAYYQRSGGPYQDAKGQDWPDNAWRFGLLSWMGAVLSSPASPLPWLPDILHCNDWQAGLAPAYAYFMPGNRAPAVMTIHNLAYQGIFPAELLVPLSLPRESFGMAGVEYFGKISFLKAGLYYARKITTVSPTYAREIQSQPLGMGMQGLLAGRTRDVVGILNGIDTSAWNPGSDRYLAASYSADNLTGKRLNKLALLQDLGLTPDIEPPLLGLVSRLTQQKGLDLLLPIVPRLVEGGSRLVVQGSGEAALEQAFRELAEHYPGRVAAVIGYDEAPAHRIEAGADIFLMPSRFEPCGLNQMYSMRYGTPPVVHATGGLADTVVDTDTHSLESGEATGFVFRDPTPAALLVAILRAEVLYHKKPAWEKLMQNAMAKDFGWEKSAREYLALYREMLAGAAAPIPL